MTCWRTPCPGWPCSWRARTCWPAWPPPIRGWWTRSGGRINCPGAGWPRLAGRSVPCAARSCRVPAQISDLVAEHRLASTGSVVFAQTGHPASVSPEVGSGALPRRPGGAVERAQACRKRRRRGPAGWRGDGVELIVADTGSGAEPRPGGGRIRAVRDGRADPGGWRHRGRGTRDGPGFPGRGHGADRRSPGAGPVTPAVNRPTSPGPTAPGSPHPEAPTSPAHR